jgi:hypothetical protein
VTSRLPVLNACLIGYSRLCTKPGPCFCS